ncbi:uncharacterized protein LOC127430838 isoform X2 [Myxocyprinus asiaticus]|uniref:uncharacterized protein LOC127430838 isoform X2 n=1 Tax=Myxocyprinus asiaticus TaxID=70543 RepID=UPI0022218D36|nr:uncharacterized protein LOC127430838 isoform X2 [Myxocyprinus asiaticus]
MKILIYGNETFPPEAEFTEELRYILLGADEDLMNRACDIILRGRGEIIDSGIFEHRKGRVSGRKIAVVKTPSSWLNHSVSFFFCCSEDESIKDQMLDCASLVFPGPHAFLLVIDSQHATGKENYLLKEIAKVFGKEALNYVVVLYIGQNNAQRISLIRNVNKFHTLEDTDQSVETLFTETDRMIHNNKCKFFIQSSYENLMIKSFSSWEKEKMAEIRQETEKPLRHEIRDIKQQHAQEMTELTERFTLTENNLKKYIDTLKCLMMDTLIKSKDIQQEVEAGASSAHDSPLIKELKACKDSETLRNLFSSVVDELNKKLEASKESETCLRKMYSSLLDDYICCENQLKMYTGELNKKLEASKETETRLRDMYTSMVDDYIRRESQYKNDIEKLQKEVKNLIAKEKQQEQKPGEAEDRDTHHIKQVETNLTTRETHINQVEKDLARRETDLERREKELKAREREMAKSVQVDLKHELQSRMQWPFSRCKYLQIIQNNVMRIIFSEPKRTKSLTVFTLWWNDLSNSSFKNHLKTHFFCEPLTQ